MIADIFNRLKYMDRRGSGFKKILGDYSIQPHYTEAMEPEFNSDNDSFLLVLKNLNYSKQAKKTSDIAKFLDLSVARTRAILSEMEEVIPFGSNSNRTYRLK